MITYEEFRTDVECRGRSFLLTVADIVESATKQNLAVADEFAEFAVGQLRMPTKAKSFDEYRNRTWDAYSQFGTDLTEHGKGMYELWRGVPGQIFESLKAKEEKVKKVAVKKIEVKKAAPKKAVAKKAAPKKAAPKKAAPKKAAPKKAAPKKAAPKEPASKEAAAE